MIREGTIDEVIELCQAIPEFKNIYPRKEFEQRLTGKDAMVLIAEIEKEPAGFKCGYQRDESNTYYSWMGGVLVTHRKSGIALKLLREMEERIKSMGYKFLTFKTLNDHKAMLIFALNYGFDIVDVVSSEKDSNPRIWLKKTIE